MKGRIIILCLLVLLPVELYGLKCEVCTSAVQSDCGTSGKHLTTCTDLTGFTTQCSRGKVGDLLTLSCGTPCVTGNKDGVGIWCCDKEGCNAGTKIGSSLLISLLPLVAIFIGKHVF